MHFVLLAALAASSEPVITRAIVEYDVAGSTSAELRKSMDANGPTDDTGRHDALTKWYVRWKYDYDQSGPQCRLANIKVTVEIDITMPRWSGDDEALSKRWAGYVAKLELHENGHAEIGIAAGRVILAAISGVSPEDDCEVANAKANALGDKQLELARKKDRDYDKKTKHGETQGAIFR